MSDDRKLGANCVLEVTSGQTAQSLGTPSADPDALRARRLVLSAVMRGLILDDPWRHDYLRNRWFGI